MAAKEEGISFFLIHGFVMWAAWTFFGLFQITLARYMKHRWQLNKMLHAISGTIVLSATLVYGIGALIKMSWAVKDDFHAYVGFIILLLTLVLAVSGIRAWSSLDNAT